MLRLRRQFLLAACLGAVLLATVGGAGATATSTTDETCSTPQQCPIAIDDNPSAPATQDQAASPYPSTIGFGHSDPCCGIIDKVRVSVTGLTHGSLADVDILLVREQFGSQPMRVIELMSDVGTRTPVANLNLTFDDEAGPLPTGAVVASGTYRPTNYAGGGPPCAADGPQGSANADPFPAPAPAPPTGGYGQSLDVFSGEQLGGGTWRLYVGDDCVGGNGSISSWSLTFFLGNGGELLLFKSADAATVQTGSPIGFTIDAYDGPGGSSGATLYDALPGGPGIDWSITSGPASCSISGQIGSETLICHFSGSFGASVHVSSPTLSGSCGTYENYAVLSSARFPPSGARDSTSVVGCPTAVTVTSLAALATADGVLVRWRAAAERGLLGFNVYREQGGRRVKLNRALIPAQPARGHGYSWLDARTRRGVSQRYWLQAVSAGGSRTWHGPVDVRR